MSDDHESAAEYLARQFHEAYENMAPGYGYEIRKETAKLWADVPENNKLLMVAVVKEVMLPVIGALETDLAVAKEERDELRRDAQENAPTDLLVRLRVTNPSGQPLYEHLFTIRHGGFSWQTPGPLPPYSTIRIEDVTPEEADIDE